MSVHNQRTIYGETLVEMGVSDSRIVVLEADLGKSTMTHLFQKAYPERYFEMGIAEQNMVSFAAGLAIAGKIAFVNSFAVFASGRAYDQIRQSVCTAGLNVKVIGSSCGLSDFGDGATHQSVEDIAIMRAIPGMTVLAPSDAVETRKMLKAVTAYDGPVYIRINRNDLPDIFPEELDFEIGKPYVLRDGSDITVFAHGVMVSKALAAAESLEAGGTSVKVVNVSSLKPVDEKAVLALAEGSKGVIIAEEHSCIGGLSGIVTGIVRGRAIPVEIIAIRDMFGQSAGNYQELLDCYGLNEEEIVKAAMKIIEGGATE